MSDVVRVHVPFLTATAFVLVLGVAPLVAVLVYALGRPDVFTEMWGGSLIWDAAWGTLRLAMYTTLIAVAIGTPLAWWTTRTDVPLRGLWRALLVIPYVVPPYIAAVAWIQLASPRIGLLNDVLGEGALDVYSMGGLTWVLALSFYPYVFLTVRAALENTDPSLEDAARMSGARTWRVFKDVTLPLLRPAVFSSAGLVFMVTASAFGAPVLIGDPARVHVLSTLAYEELQTGGADPVGRAASVACLLLLFVAIPLVLRARHYATVGGRASRPTRLPLGKARVPVATLVGLFALIAVVLPALAVVITAFSQIAGRFALDNLTLDNLRVLEQKSTTEAIVTSLGLAAAAATIAVALGGVLSYYRLKTRVPGRNVVSTMAIMPLAAPGTVLAIGLLLVWSGTLTLVNTIWIVLIAYVVKYVALAARAVGEGIGTIDDALPEAARLSGAKGLFLARTIWTPLVWPSVMAGWFLVFMPCFSELTMSILLVSPGIETVGTRMFELQQYEAPASASVLATVVLILVVGTNLLLRLVSRGRYGI